MFCQNVKGMNDFSIGGDSFGDSGCAVSSAIHHAEQIRGVYYSMADVKRLCKELEEKGIIDKDFFVESWDLLFDALGVSVITKFRPRNYYCHPDEIEILNLCKTGFRHFVPGDGTGHYSWDSLGRRDAQADYVIEDKRIMQLV